MPLAKKPRRPQLRRARNSIRPSELASANGSARLLEAAKNADWQQVVFNGGPPCFHLEDGRFCLRAERWDGHKTIGGSGPIHEYVSLESLLRSVTPPND